MNTGEFARLCGVEKRTLFHYDEIGLLKPAAVKENGYRIYHPEQLYDMDMIKIFQASGYTLAQIKALLQTDRDGRSACLREAETRLDAQIQALSNMKAYLRSKQTFLDEYQSRPLEGGCRRPCAFSYRLRELEPSPQPHVFNFLSDGLYASFVMKRDGSVRLCQITEDGPCRKEGTALVFFLEISVVEPNLPQLIQDKLQQFDFDGEDLWFVEDLPHFLVPDPSTALLKITVFSAR